MKFTVIFSSHEACDLSFGLVFVPCPVWTQGKKYLVNLNPENPAYQLGGVKKLVKESGISFKGIEKPLAACVIVHREGYGTWQDLQTLLKDLEEEGFRTQLVSLTLSTPGFGGY